MYYLLHRYLVQGLGEIAPSQWKASGYLPSPLGLLAANRTQLPVAESYLALGILT